MGILKNFVTPLHKQTKRNYVERMTNNKVYCSEVAKKYSKDFNSLYSHSLEDIIVNSDLWKKDLHESWNNRMDSPINPRLEMCANHCGEHCAFSDDNGDHIL